MRSDGGPSLIWIYAELTREMTEPAIVALSYGGAKLIASDYEAHPEGGVSCGGSAVPSWSSSFTGGHSFGGCARPVDYPDTLTLAVLDNDGVPIATYRAVRS